MRSIPVTRPLRAITFGAGTTRQTLSRRLERGRPIKVLRMNARLVITVTTVGPGAYHEDSPHRVVQALRIRRPGGDPRVDVSGYGLETVRAFENGTPSFVSQPALSAATLTIEWDMSYAFAPGNSPFEDAWGLILPESGDDQVEIDANPTALFATAPTTYTVDSFTVTLEQEEDAAPNAARIMAAHSPLRRPLVRHLVTTNDAVSSASSRQPVPGNNIAEGGDVEAVWFIGRTGATPVRGNDFISRLAFKYGGVSVLDESFGILRRRQKQYTGLEVLPTGVVYYPLDSSRLLRRTFRTKGLTGTRFELDTAAATSPAVELIRSEVFGQ